MSSALATHPPVAATAGWSGDGRLRAWRSPVGYTMVALLAVAFVGLFHRWFAFQHKHSWGNDDWSHVYMVPLISGYVIWRRRDLFAGLRVSVFWPGFAVMALGVLCYYFFVMGVPNHMLQGFSIVLTVFGATLLLLGPRLITLLAFPIGYLVFGVTVSEMIMLRVTFVLQALAAKGAWVLLNLIGLSTEIAGNTLEITTSRGQTIPLNVAEACSGMRMVVAFLALGVVVAFVSCREWWQRAALICLAVPVALFTNVLRVTSLGVASLVNRDLASGEAHMFIGMLWLLPAFLMFMAVVWALNKMVRDGGGGAS